MSVIGIDPGLASTGYGVVARRAGRLVALDGGVIETSPQRPLPERLATIHGRVATLLAEHATEAMAVEGLYWGRNVQTATAVGQARGVVLLAAAHAGLRVESFTPQEVKQGVCGSGRADKAQVQRMVGMLLALPAPPEPDHAADALAVAICLAGASPGMRAASSAPVGAAG